ncbi:MAG: VCBS repeat-containing protein [Candidatus Eisenbacteria bacterium]|uniref:VCBS repeat-containing protein n=1 Tax=Eiseniibacteriota bacterium TaxID=2212470 RepID=A0A956NAY0_UNCEI|nr:VCBS repeat-containing protein [Candidatus Eisenbacteria bacterium]
MRPTHGSLVSRAFHSSRCTHAVFLTVLMTCTPRMDAAAATFTETPEFGTANTICVVWADLDSDADLDLIVGNYFNQANPIYWNQGDGTFALGPNVGAGSSFAVAAFDFDNDGDLDVAVGNGSNQQNWLFENDGTGVFSQRNEFGLRSTVALAAADFDLDGDLDLAIGNGILGANQPNALFVNQGDGTFVEEAQFGEMQSCTLAWGDCDGDGDPDLAVGNGGFGTVQQNYLYRNNGDGTFTAEEQFGIGDTSSLAWGDADNDGDLDLAVANWNAGQNYLYVNDGAGTFTELPRFGLRDPNTLSWGDVDNDGDLDLAVGNGDFGSADQNYLYVNDGALGFTEEAQFGVGSTDGVSWADVDGDGDLDLASGNEHTPTTNYLYLNDGAVGHWLEVELVGRFHELGTGYSNRNAVGAKVSVYEAGSLGDPGALIGFREVTVTGGFTSQLPLASHFGIPQDGPVDLRIEWPGSAGTHQVQELLGVAIDQTLVVIEGLETSSVPVTEPDGSHGPSRSDSGMGGDGSPWLGAPWPNPTRGDVSVEYSLRGLGSARIGLYDAAGRCLQSLHETRGSLEETGTKTGVATFDLSDMALASGTYFLELEVSGQKVERQFIVVR